ncbi:DUF262 domain-containing protein [Streptomyces sp. NPDC059153]|uniref:DUF262 domain-containing protein n=1 Tax=Streptomyces sp. NPDC059153 TaxID=3346743 RepID=UPI0036800D92
MAIIKQAARQTLGQLIGANNPAVTVPDDSQRQYAWTKKEVDIYWSDIQKFKKARDSGKDSASEYFIGPIVTITDKKVSTRSLLDGQQRLTTSTILIAAIRDILWRMGSTEGLSTANNLHRDYIARKAGRREPMEYFLVLSLFDRDFFRDYIQDWNENTGKCAGIERPTRPSHKLIKEAYANFEGKIATELSSFPDDEEKLDWLDGLRECLINGLVFVEIQTPTSSDANEVFETINSRGKDLSTVDLVRNFLMEKSRSDSEKQRVNDAWRVILDGFERREEIERFLRHFWVSKHGDVKSHSLYTIIRQNLSREFNKNPQVYGVGAFAAELEGASIRYIDLINCSTGHPEFDAALYEIEALSADALYPLLLAASERMDYEHLQDLIDASISYYVRWTVVGRRESTLLEENIFDAAKSLSGGASIDSTTRRICDWIPDDETFKADFEEASTPKSSQSRYLLGKIEACLRASANVDEVVLATSAIVHVEHIYPQKPADEWRLEDHDAWVNRIGNLTLLNGRKNQSVSKLPYSQKASIYEESVLLVSSDTETSRIWDSQKNWWKIDGIVERQRDLAGLAISIWPGGKRWD